MHFYAVIDTNVVVAALLTKNKNSPTLQVVNYVLNGTVTPLYHKEILQEYEEVLKRPKFHLDPNIVEFIVESIRINGIEAFPKPFGEILVDMDDLIFYEVALEKSDTNAFLVTGNQKHYPIKNFIVSPAEMVEIVNLYSPKTLHDN